VFVRSDGRAIQAEFVDPDGDSPPNPATPATGAAGKPIALSEMILAATGSDAELDASAARAHERGAQLASSQWEDMKAGLADGIWQLRISGRVLTATSHSSRLA
jgi:hypothetical protein